MEITREKRLEEFDHVMRQAESEEVRVIMKIRIGKKRGRGRIE